MWDGIEEFIHVAEKGNFTLAAKEMDVSVSHISRQITRLEAYLAVVLVKRTTRKVTLTEEGRQHYLRLKQIRKQLVDATNQLQGNQDSLQGLIKLTGAGMFVARQISPVLASFVKRHPDVSIDIDFTNRNVSLVEEGVDLAIRFGRLEDSNLIARPLSNRQMSLVASPDYIKLNGMPKSTQELKQHNCLITVTNRWRFQIEGKPEEVKVNSNWRSNNSEAVIQACMAGLGIAHFAKDLVQHHVDEGRLRYVMDDMQVSDNATWLVYPRKDIMPQRVRVLIDYLLAHFDNKMALS